MKEDKEQPEKTIQLTPAQRKAAILKIAQSVKNNPEFKAKVDKMIAEVEIKLIVLEFLEGHKEQLSEKEFKNLNNKLESGQLKWTELPIELRNAYNQFGKEERQAEWRKKVPEGMIRID